MAILRNDTEQFGVLGFVSQIQKANRNFWESASKEWHNEGVNPILQFFYFVMTQLYYVTLSNIIFLLILTN